MPTSDAGDAIPALALALSVYLEALDGSLDVCVRHAPFSDLRACRDGMLRITRRYRLPDSADRVVEAHIGRFLREVVIPPTSTGLPGR